MPLSDPTRYRDKTLDWMAWFNARRCADLAVLLTPELIAEHERNPFGMNGPHSAALQEVLIFLRSAPTPEKPFAYAEEPHRRYRVGRMRGRGQAPDIATRPVYTSEQAAVHAVFLQRLIWLGFTLPART